MLQALAVEALFAVARECPRDDIDDDERCGGDVSETRPYAQRRSRFGGDQPRRHGDDERKDCPERSQLRKSEDLLGARPEDARDHRARSRKESRQRLELRLVYR